MKLFDDSWDLRIGEVKIKSSEGIQYVLVVGYAAFDKKLYFRLYDVNDKFIVGQWFDCIYKVEMSLELIEKIKKQVLRLEALKVFA